MFFEIKQNFVEKIRCDFLSRWDCNTSSDTSSSNWLVIVIVEMRLALAQRLEKIIPGENTDESKCQ